MSKIKGSNPNEWFFNKRQFSYLEPRRTITLMPFHIHSASAIGQAHKEKDTQLHSITIATRIRSLILEPKNIRCHQRVSGEKNYMSPV